MPIFLFFCFENVQEKNPPFESDDKVNFGLGWNVKVSGGFGDTPEPDFLECMSPVFLSVSLGPLEDDLALCLASLMGGGEEGNHCVSNDGKKEKKKAREGRNEGKRIRSERWLTKCAAQQ